MATRVLADIANYLATVPLQRKQQQYENELANRRLALQEDEAARKAEADKLALENAQFEQQQRNEGQSALGEYNRAAEIQPSINELKQGKELTKNVAPYSMDYLLAQPEATPLALADRYKLNQYSKYNKGVEGELEQVNKVQEKSKGENQPFNLVGARIKYDTPEYRSVINSEIDKELSNGKITPEQADFAKGQVQNGFAYDYGQAFRENGVVAALKRGVKIADEYALSEPKANTAATTTAAKEYTQRDIQAANPILSENQGNALQDSYSAVKYLNQMKNALEKGNIDWFDQTKIGEFKNPQMNNARNQMVEIVGRKRSGAAISDSEWGNFQNQVLNKNYLLTEEGRKEALNNIDDYLDRFYGAGVTTTGNEDWFTNYEQKAKGARSKAEKTLTEPTKAAAGQTVTTIKSDEEYNKLPSGSVFVGPDGKKRTKP